MRTLAGQRIVVTRAAHQAEELARPLRDLGAAVLLLPALAIVPPLNPARLRQAAAESNAYDWIVFTSVNAIEAFVAQLALPPSACRAQIATVGAATRSAAERHGFRVSLAPQQYVAEALVEAWPDSTHLDGVRILIPSAALTRDVVAGELRQRGADVDVVEAYRNVVPAESAQRVAEVLRDPYPDWITFTSSSSVSHLVALSGTESISHSKIATIGPITSQTVRDVGLLVAREARPHDIPGLIAALCE